MCVVTVLKIHDVCFYNLSPSAFLFSVYVTVTANLYMYMFIFLSFLDRYIYICETGLSHCVLEIKGRTLYRHL